MNANESQTISLAAGQVLTVTAPPGATGSVVRLSRVPGGGDSQSTTLIAGANLTFGPYARVERFNIICIVGTVTPTIGSASILDSSAEDKIFVKSNGDDTDGLGTEDSPFATLTKAFSLVTTTRKKVIIDAGEYNEAAAVVWPDVNGVELICPNGQAVVSSVASVTHIIGIDPAASAGTWSATLGNILIDHGHEQIGLQVDNASVGKRINLFLKNFDTNAGGVAPGASIDINRTGTAAIRVYADGNGNTIEGLVTGISESTDDRFRFKGYRLVGGLTLTGAIACEVTLINTGILTGGKSLDGAMKLTNIGCWYETDANPNVYTALANAYATYT
jgi:hypothetical protein